MPDAPPPHPLARQQARFNLSTRGHWSHFASHRDRIHQLVVGDGSLGTGGRLCVLGAGNCNDLDLPELIRAFERVVLVDLDPRAVQEAVGRQGVDGSGKVHVRAPVDLSGVADLMAEWAGKKVSAADAERWIRRITQAPLPDLDGPFDVVLSPCVLSQIAGYANDTLGKGHAKLNAVRDALRDRHLRVMAELLAPGGWGVLVTDVASSRVVPDLAHKPPDRLPALLKSLVGRGSAYAGLGPDAVEQALRADPLLAAQLCEINTLPPWVWTLGPLKSFLVYALRFRRSRGTILLG